MLRQTKDNKQGILSSYCSYMLVFIFALLFISVYKFFIDLKRTENELSEVRYENTILENKIRNLVNNQLMLSKSYSDLIDSMNDKTDEKLNLISNLNKSLLKLVREDHQVAVLVKRTGILNDLENIDNDIKENKERANDLKEQQSRYGCSHLGLKLSTRTKLMPDNELGINAIDNIECYLKIDKIRKFAQKE